MVNTLNWHAHAFVRSHIIDENIMVNQIPHYDWLDYSERVEKELSVRKVTMLVLFRS